MNISYLLYQAERPRSAAEQREADVRAGQLAATVTRAGHSLRQAITRSDDGKRANRGPAAVAAPCAVPRPR